MKAGTVRSGFELMIGPVAQVDARKMSVRSRHVIRRRRVLARVTMLLIASVLILPLAAISDPASAEPTCAGQAPTIVGSPGDDTIQGTPDNDVITLGAGDDLVRAGAGN